MSRMRHLLRQFIKEVFQSHSVEPDVGDLVQNVNPNCKHHGSKGVVVSISSLDDDAGKVVGYQCTNCGPAWSKGDVLEKTMDQLSSLELSGIY